MDKLSQFFIAPLLLKDSVDREIESVESEYQMRVKSNVVQKQQLMLSLAHENHQVDSFTWGNIASLKKQYNR